GLLLVALGDVGPGVFARFGSVAAERELKPAAAAGPLGIIVEGPQIARAVVADRGGTKLAGNERRDERPATLVGARDEPNGQASAAAFAVDVQAQRPGGASSSAGLIGTEEAEEDAAAGRALGQRQGPRRMEFVVERHGADRVGVVRRLGRSRDL